MEKESKIEDLSANRRGFVRKLVAAVAASGLAGLLLGRSPQPALGATNTFPPDGNVGIGTTSPLVPLHIKSASSNPAIMIENENNHVGEFIYCYSSSGHIPFFSGRRARGTMASPSAVQADDTLMRYGGSGYGTSGFPGGNRAILEFKAAENWGDYVQGTYITMSTTPTGSNVATERMRIDNAGNVGIGTTNPQAALDVHSPIGIGGYLDEAVVKVSRNSATGAAEFALATSGDTKWSLGLVPFTIPSPNSDDLQLYNPLIGKATMAFTRSNNNVGIGTNSPASPLQVGDGSLILPRPDAKGIFINTTPLGASNVTVEGDSGANLVLTKRGAPVNQKMMQLAIDADNLTKFRSLADNGVITKDIIAMQHSTGNVGIGTTSPLAHLETTDNRDATAAGAGNLALRVINSDGTDSHGVGIGFTNSTSVGNVGAKIVHIRKGINDVGDLAFYTNNDPAHGGDTTTEKVRITSNGNVGIKNIAPLRTVDANGTVRISDVDSNWTTANWLTALELLNGQAILWRNTGTGFGRGIGSTNQGDLYITRSTALDNSANPTYDMTIAKDGTMTIGKGIMQPGDQNGVVKAAVYMDATGLGHGDFTLSVIRSFNNLPGGTTPTVTRWGDGDYIVDFGVDVSSRYFSATCSGEPSRWHPCLITAICHWDPVIWPNANPNKVEVNTYCYLNSSGPDQICDKWSLDSPFFLLVY